MQLTLDFNSAILDKLEATAKEQGKPSVKKLLEDNLEALSKLRPGQNNIVLSQAHLAALSAAVGGKLFKTPEDVVKLVAECLRIKVGGVEVELQPEDAQMLNDQFTGFSSFLTKEEFIRDMVLDAISLHLWGSTRGTVAYK